MKQNIRTISLMALGVILLLNVAFGGTEPTDEPSYDPASKVGEVKGPRQIQYQYPILSNKQIKVYQGDTITHVIANGIPAIIARPGQNVPKLLASVNLSRSKFAKINDTPPLFIDELIAGAVYYLKNKKSKATVPFHYAQPKETIWDIAQMYGMKKSKLLKRNRMSAGDELQLGRKLYLQGKRKSKTPVEFNKDIKPNPSATGPWARFIDKKKEAKAEKPLESITRIDEKATNKATIDPNAKFHTIREGETIFDVSKAYNVTVLELKEWNNLDYNNISLKPGEVIIVKGDKLPQTNPFGNNNASTGGGADPLAPAIILKPEGAGADNTIAGGVNANTSGGNIAGAAASTAQMHEVKRGEGIYGIARQYGASAKDLMAWNSMDNGTMLTVGQQIYVSDPSVAVSAVNSSNINTSGANTTFDEPYSISQTGNSGGSALPVDQTHTVEKGETLYSISRKYNVKVADMMSWNGLAGSDINAGQELLVSAPIASGATETGGATATFNTGGTAYDAYNVPASSNNNNFNQVAGAAETAIDYSQPAGAANNYNLAATGGDQVAGATDFNQVAGAVALPADSNNSGQNQHIVQNGDDIYTLAARYNVTVENLRKWNDIPFGIDIQPGQVLIVADNTMAGAGTVDYNQVAGAGGEAANLQALNAAAATDGTAGQTIGFIPQAGGNTQQADYGAVAATEQFNQVAEAGDVSGSSLGADVMTFASKTHMVKKGQTLYAIAKLYNVGVSDIMELNGMSSDAIQAGQELIVVGESSSPVHTVKKDETLYSISRKYKMSVDELKRLNGKSDDDIIVGEKLRVQ